VTEFSAPTGLFELLFAFALFVFDAFGSFGELDKTIILGELAVGADAQLDGFVFVFKVVGGLLEVHAPFAERVDVG
jgi:hypothetical protein